MSTFLLIFLFILILTIIYVIRHYNQYLQLLEKAKSIQAPIVRSEYQPPIVGLVKFFLGLERDLSLNIVTEHFRKTKDPIVQTIVGTYHNVWICDDKMAKEVFIKKEKNFRKPDGYSFIEQFGKNIVTLNGKDWAKQRNLFNPLFSIDGHLQSVVDASILYTKRMEQYSLPTDTVVFDFELRRHLHDLALDVISDVAFGYDIHATDHKELKDFKDLPEGVALTLKESLDLSLKALIYNFLLGKTALAWIPLPSIRKLSNAINDFNRYMDFFIEKYKVKQNSLLEMLINPPHESSFEMNVSEIKGNMFIFFFAGHETTAGTLHWTLLYLAQNPNVQQKLFEIVNKVLNGRDPQFSDLESLSYALWVFKETLRLKPALRSLLKSTVSEIEIGGVKLPKETNINISIKNIHTNPLLWKDPLTFNPDRFGEAYEPSTFIPFSYGPRNCIGYRFAEIEATIVLSMLAQKYTFHLKPEHSVEEYMEETSVFTTCPKNPHNIILKRRVL